MLSAEKGKTMEQNNEVRYQVVAQDETNTCWIEAYNPTGYAQVDCSYSAPVSLEEAQKELDRIECLGYRVTGQR